MLEDIRRRIHDAPPARLIVISFAIIIVVGGILLCMPFCTRSGQATHPIDAFFTAGSATCVTGLIPFDTYMHWNMAGQVIILLLIQVGGLGLVTFTTGASLLMRKRMGLRNLKLAAETTSGNAADINGLIRIILVFTFGCELLGAAILMCRFVPLYGADGIWVSIFTSVSAYCNAGFDILGFVMPSGNLIPFAGDPLVILTVAGLIIIGGLGFIVISDIYQAKLKPVLLRKARTPLCFHTRVVLLVSAVLLILGTVLFLVLEQDNTLRGMPPGERLNVAFFQSVSARTAGFASVDIGSELDFTKIVTIVLMFIGASPAGTGGGIKTTTLLVIICTVRAVMRGDEEAVFSHRRIDKFAVYRAMAITFMGALIVIVTTGILSAVEPNANGIDLFFEATSAFGTVGISAGVTPGLSALSKFVLILTMFIGRVGPVSLGLAVSLKHSHAAAASSVLPEGKIIVG